MRSASPPGSPWPARSPEGGWRRAGRSARRHGARAPRQPIATGLVVTFSASGSRPVRPVRRRPGRRATTWPVPVLHSIPFFGPILFEHDPLTYISYFVGPAAWWFLFHPERSDGAHRRRAGRGAARLRYLPTKVRFYAILAGGALPAWRRAVDLAGPQLVGEHDGRPRLRRCGPRDLRGLEPADGHRGRLPFSGGGARAADAGPRLGPLPFLLDAMPYLLVIVVLAAPAAAGARRSRGARPGSRPAPDPAITRSPSPHQPETLEASHQCNDDPAVIGVLVALLLLAARQEL